MWEQLINIVNLSWVEWENQRSNTMCMMYLANQVSLAMLFLVHTNIMSCSVLDCPEPVRHSTRDKGHEEGGSAYAKAGSSLRSPPGYSRTSTPHKNRVCLLDCFVLSPLTLPGAVPHHHLAVSVKELTYSSN